MKLKKIAVLLSAITVLNLNSLNVSATADGGFTVSEINASELKPILSLPKIELTLEQAKANPNITVSLSVSDVNLKYSTLEVWTSFDERLKINSKEKGEAMKYMSCKVQSSQYIDSSTGNLVDLNGIRVISSCGRNMGKDGAVFTSSVTLPENVQAGDIFPLEIVYMDSENSNNNFVNSTLTNVGNDEIGNLMQAWAFTNGIQNGYIKITANNTKIPGDVNLDGNVTLSDAVNILQYVSNSEKYFLSEQALENADVFQRGDGVTAMDALSIQKFDSGIIEALPESFL